MTQGSILIIEDDLDIIELLKYNLSTEGYSVVTASSGEVGLEHARSAPPDLILLDIKMPELDGYQVCQRLKQLESAKEVPIIFISALEDTLDYPPKGSPDANRDDFDVSIDAERLSAEPLSDDGEPAPDDADDGGKQRRD